MIAFLLDTKIALLLDNRLRRWNSGSEQEGQEVLLAVVFVGFLDSPDAFRQRGGTQRKRFQKNVCDRLALHGLKYPEGKLPTPKCHSVLKAVALLKAFRETDGWATTGQLSKLAGVPESSGYRLINTLVDLGMVLRGPSGYRLGANLLSLSRGVCVDECLKVASADILPALAARLDTTVHLARLEGEMMLYVAKAATPHSCAVPSKCGSRFEPYSTAAGKLLLAALQPSALETFFAGDLIALTPHTVTDKKALLSELSEIQRVGFASDRQEFHPNISSIAVAVHDGEGQVIASLSASEVPSRMTPQRQLQLKGALSTAAEEIAAILFKSNRSALAARPVTVGYSAENSDAEAYA